LRCIKISREKDEKLIKEISKEKLPDFVFMHLRNMWAVDGLYYLFIEEEYGTKVATDIDRKVWEVMGKIEARKIKKLLNIKGNDIKSLMDALSYSGWAMDLEDKEIIVKKDSGIIRNVRCRVQNTRLSKGLPEFGCKPVRFGFLKSFAKEINSEIELTCNVCPPDKHPKDLWCEWVFTLKK
jgi:hypothetical protein